MVAHLEGSTIVLFFILHSGSQRGAEGYASMIRCDFQSRITVKGRPTEVFMSRRVPSLCQQIWAAREEVCTSYVMSIGRFS